MKTINEQIPFVDLAGQSNELAGEIMPAIERVIRRAAFILGEEVQEFEEKFADYCDTSYCVSTASGTDAIHLALRAVGIGPGDEVITAGNSFVASAYAISHAGARPVLVDINESDHNLNVDLIERAVTTRTKAIVPVHLYGQPSEMEAIGQIAEKHGLKIVEDACQAHGAEYRGKRTGALGHAGCFSFYPGKNLGAFGDGGAVVTDDPKIAEQLRLLRNYGQRQKNVHSLLAFNSRLDTIQAAVLLAKLPYLDDWNNQRRKAARWYREYLQDSELILPVEHDNVRHVYHLFVVKHERRDELMKHLQEQNIFCGIHYPNPIHHAEPYATIRSIPRNLPVCSRLADQIFSLPMFPGITETQVSRVCEAIKSFQRLARKMSDDLTSNGRPGSFRQTLGRKSAFLRVEQARVGNWLATVWQRLLLGTLILEIPIQLDTYLYHDLEDAKFGAISGFNVSLTSVCLVLLYLQWLPRQFAESRRFVVSKSLVTYVALTGCSMLWAVDWSRTLFQLFLLIQALLIFIYVVNQVKTRRDVLFVMTCLMIGLAVQGLSMCAAKLTGDDIVWGPLKFEIINATNRVTGSFSSPNVAGSYFGLLLAPCFSLLLMPVSRRIKFLALFAFLVGGISLVFTMSRGGWLTSAFSVGLVSLIGLYQGWIPRRVVFGCLAASLLFVGVFHESVSERLLGDDNGSMEGRRPLNSISHSMIAENPLGIGGNNWDRVAQWHAGRSRYRGEWYYFVHNKYLLVCAETGWLGLLAYLAFLGSTLVCGWRAIKRNDRWLSPLALGLTAGLVAQMIHMSMDVFNGRSQIQLLWLIAALIVAVAHLALNTESENTAEPSTRAASR